MNKLRKTRTALATVFFILITLLLLDFTGTLHTWLGWMAKIQFLPALLAINVGVILMLAVLTLVVGRIYCSIICPLAVLQDIVSCISAKRPKKKHRFSYSAEKRWLRYGILVLFVVAFVAGVGSIVALLAPYSSYGRMVQNIFQPFYIVGNNALAWIAERANSYAFYSRDIWVRSLPTFFIAATTLLLVVTLAWRNGRTYCNTICPVGTLLSFLARFAWFKIRIDNDKCNKCGLCARSCKAACINSKDHTIDASRCVVCGDCIDQCRQQALSFTHNRKKSVNAPTTTDAVKDNDKDKNKNNNKDKDKDKDKTETVNTARRSFIVGTTIATTTAALAQEKKKVDGGIADIIDKQAPHRDTPLKPAGSISAQNMARHCTACQLCVAACPNDVLRPSTRLLTLMQPTMSYERGYCRPECTRCSEACPTGAIKPITVEEKSSIQIGHAVWIKKNCIPITDGKACGNCARHCPTAAITMISSNPDNPSAPMIPAINTERCIGCGACENLCPARPFSAIYVEGHEVHRHI